MNNPWRLCKDDPPKQYIRIEIKSKNNDRYIGYRYLDHYYETIGNYIISDPYKWRYIPVGSYLWNEIVERIRRLSLYNEEPVYGIRSLLWKEEEK